MWVTRERVWGDGSLAPGLSSGTHHHHHRFAALGCGDDPINFEADAPPEQLELPLSPAGAASVRPWKASMHGRQISYQNLKRPEVKVERQPFSCVV